MRGGDRAPGRFSVMSDLEARATRHAGYAISQRIRKKIEEGFGWIKTNRPDREKNEFRGSDRIGWAFTFAAAAII